MRVLVTGGAGFIGSHLCDFLLAKGGEVVCMDNLSPAPATTSPTSAIRAVPVRQARRHQLHRTSPGPLDYVLHFASPASPDRLPRAAHPDPQGRRARHPQGARPRQGQAGPVPARLDLGGLRRSPRPPAARGLLGQRQPGGPARGLRRGQALRRGHDHGLPPRTTASTRASCASSTPTARACGSTTAARSRPSSRQALRGRAPHRLRRRLPDALVHLRLRPRRRHLAPDAGRR